MKDVRAFYLAAIITLIFLASLTIASELSDGLTKWLKTTFYHHWVGKGILSILVFALFSIVGYYSSFLDFVLDKKDLKTWSIGLVVITFVLIVAILGFFYSRFLSG